MGTRIEMTLTNNTTKVYQDDQVVSANIMQAQDPLLTELAIGTLECVLYSSSDEFNILNPNGIMDYIAENQKVVIYYDFPDNVSKQLGVYYVDSWEQERNRQMRLKCVDAIGLLEKQTYRGNYTLVSGTTPPITTLPVGQLFYNAGVINNKNWIYNNYPNSMRGAIAGQLEGGTAWTTNMLPITNSRELLQSILLANNCGILIKSDGTPYLFANWKNGTGPSGTRRDYREVASQIIRKNRILYNSTTRELPEKINSIIQYRYTGIEKGDLETIYDGKDDGIITFDNCYSDFTITNGTINESGRGYVKFTGTSTNNKVVRGKKNTLKGDKYVVQLLNDEKGKVIENRTPISQLYGGYQEKFDPYWYNYYNNGFITTLDIILNSDMEEVAGTIVKTELEPNKAYEGVIMECDIDVTGGMIATLKILCSKNYTTITE